MRSRDQNPLRMIETLPPPAQVDLIEFIESSAQASDADEGEYLAGILDLHRDLGQRRSKGGS